MENIVKRLLRLGLVIVFLVSIVPEFVSLAQNDARLRVARIDDTTFPEVKVYVTAMNEKGVLIEKIPIEDFTIYEDGNKVQILSAKIGLNEKQPLSLVLTIDITDRYPLFSQTMELTKEFISGLPQIDRLAISTYSSDYQKLSDFSQDKVKAASLIDSIVKKGEATAFFDSIEKSINLLKDEPEPRILLLLGNGQESKISKKNIDDIIKLAIENHVQIFALGYGTSVYKDVLDKLAQSTGGKTYYLPGKEEYKQELRTAYKKLFEGLLEVKKQYILSYKSSLAEDGTSHEVKVEINHQGWKTSDKGKMIACAGILKVCLPTYLPENTVGSKECMVPNIFSPDPPIEKFQVTLDGKVICSATNPPFECCLAKENIKEGMHKFEILVQDSPFEPAKLVKNLMVRPNMRIEIKGPDSILSTAATASFTATIDSLNPLEKIIIKIDEKQIDELKQLPTPRSRYPFIYIVPLNIPTNQFPLGDHRIILIPFDEKNISQEGEKSVYVRTVDDGGGAGWIWWLIGLGVVFGGVFLYLRRGQSGVGTAILREIQGINPGQEWQLGKDQISLGRKSTDNDIPLSGLGASRYMARISFEDGKHIIRSLKVENPVFVNNQPVESWELQNGDQIQAGESIFVYELRG